MGSTPSLFSGMTRRRTARERREETYSPQINTSAVGFLRQSSRANGSSVLTSLVPLRFKSISAIYEAEDSLGSNLQQTSGESSTPSKDVESESVSTPDDATMNVILKDLRKRCNSRKRKAPNPVEDSTSDLCHALVESKEEEPDLDEPIICLKSKSPNKSSSGRKQRKHSHLSESILTAEETTEHTPNLSYNQRELSLSAALERPSTAKEAITEDESTNVPGSIDENLLVTTDNEVKSEVAKIDSVGSKNASNVSISSIPYFTRNCRDPGNSSDELHEQIGNGELEHGNSTFCATEPLKCCTGEVSFEFMEAESCINLQESREENPDCYDSEVSTKHVETDRCTCVPESSKECHEENSLEGSINSFSKSVVLKICTENSQSVSANRDFNLDVDAGERPFSTTRDESMHEDITSQTDKFSITGNQGCVDEQNNSTALREEFHDQVDQMPTCIDGSSLTAECSLLRRHTPYRHNASGFSEEVGSLGSLVFKAHCDAPRNNSEGCDNSRNETKYDLRDPQHGSTFCSSSCDSCADDVCLSKTKSSHCLAAGEILSQCTEKAANSAEVYAEELTNSPSEKGAEVEGCDPCVPVCPDAFFDSACDLHAASESTPATESLNCSRSEIFSSSHSEDVEERGNTIDFHSPQVLLADSGTLNGFVNVPDSSSDTSCQVQSSPEVTVSAAMHNRASGIPKLLDGEGSDMDTEQKCDQGMMRKHRPKRLFSNRKYLSPTSQEKLRRALNCGDIDDSMKNPKHEEAAVMLRSSDKTTGRSKSSRHGSPPSLSKGTHRPQDAFDRNCSCSKDSLIYTQAQKAVKFTERQMQDIENIATKLLKGLASMKNIVVERMDSEACQPTPSSFTPEEIKMAVDDVSNLEATTKKYLSMMAKDCSRFCKIMKSTESSEATPPSARKQPKKITFADEAGGSLCDVKVFDQLASSSL